jgi:hypothetical protein
MLLEEAEAAGREEQTADIKRITRQQVSVDADQRRSRSFRLDAGRVAIFERFELGGLIDEVNERCRDQMAANGMSLSSIARIRPASSRPIWPSFGRPS